MSGEPAHVDRRIGRGYTTNWLYQCRLAENPKLVADLRLWSIHFKAQLPDGSAISASTDSGGVSVEEITLNGVSGWGGVRVSLSPATARLFPAGKACPYEIERRQLGKQLPLVRGTITGWGGVNDD